MRCETLWCLIQTKACLSVTAKNAEVQAMFRCCHSRPTCRCEDALHHVVLDAPLHIDTKGFKHAEQMLGPLQQSPKLAAIVIVCDDLAKIPMSDFACRSHSFIPCHFIMGIIRVVNVGINLGMCFGWPSGLSWWRFAATLQHTPYFLNKANCLYRGAGRHPEKNSRERGYVSTFNGEV